MSNPTSATRSLDYQNQEIETENPIVNLLAGDDTNFTNEVFPRLPKLSISQGNPHSAPLGRLYLHHNRAFQLLQSKANEARRIRSE